MPDTRQRDWPLRWELLLRYRLIEIIALWEGRLTTNHLCDTFGIGRQQASKDINHYKVAAAGNLEYDTHLKGYKPTAAFVPVFTQGVVDEYLHLMARNNELSSTFESLSLQVANTEVLAVPVRNVEPAIIQAIVRAARGQKRLEVDYVSVHNPDREGRIIVPHTLVNTGLRWHVRAWCEKNQAYRDFVLSRFRDVPEILDGSAHGIEEDSAWNHIVAIRLQPDPRLKPAQREVVAHDYGMVDNILQIECRAVLVEYALQALHIEPHKSDKLPEAQQIVVANLQQLEPWLFNQAVP